MTSEISVVVASLGRFGPLLDTIDDLMAQLDVAFDIVVVDQNRFWPAELRERRASLMSDIRVRWLEHVPPGVVTARNLGVEMCAGTIVAFVDDDVRIPDRRFLAQHVEAYIDDSVAAVCGREVHPPIGIEVPVEPAVPGRGRANGFQDASALRALLSFNRGQAAPSDTAVFSTCNGSLQRSAFLAVGGFDEHFAGASYGDDADLALRLRAANLRVVYDPKPWLVHLLAPRGGLRLSDPGNPFGEFDRALSGWIFALRHAKGTDRWRLIYGWVLRRTLLLKRNVVRPWRWPRILIALGRSYRAAKAAVAAGPKSRFTAATSGLSKT